MKQYAVWITLVKSYDAPDDGDAFEQAMNDIENRDGMEISNHEVIYQGEADEMDENATIKALPLYKKLIELAAEAEDISDKASATIGLTKIKQRGRHSAFLEAAAMVKESTE